MSHTSSWSLRQARFRTTIPASETLLAHPDAVEPRRVVVRDRAALGSGDALEHLRDHAARARPVAAVVRIIRRPHHAVDADGVPVLHSVVVDDEGEGPVRAHVVARLPLELDLGPVLVPVVAV